MNAPAPIEFFAPGIPRPGGSKRGFVNPKTKRVIIVDAAGQGNKDWRAAVAWAARTVFVGGELLRGPLTFEFHFVMPRPGYHYRGGGHRAQLRPDAPTVHTVAPDATKLTRSTEDALTGVVWADDAQVCGQFVTKKYGAEPGCRVVIRPVGTQAVLTPPEQFQLL